MQIEALPAESWPAGRASHAMWITDAGDVFLFGGAAGFESSMEDMWSFLSNSTWVHIPQMATPNADVGVQDKVG